ncbi:MAG: hypothetical protein JWQ27_3097 [Ferruginibacter sp.]|nr:hypothetical protein [Ferruginibacter sp.]
MQAGLVTFRRSLFFLLLILLSFSAVAQDATTPAKQAAPGNNLLVIVMAVVALVLAFVIWGMGQVLITMGRQALEKQRNTNKILAVTGLLFLVNSFQPLHAQTEAAAEVVQTVSNYGGMNAAGFWPMVIVLVLEMAVIGFLLFSIRRIQQELLPEKIKSAEPKLRNWWAGLDKKLFTRAVAVEQEADILLDHDYDGIRELDNSLPPWWKYGFILTIIVAVVYMLNFHVLGSGKNPTQEYEQELAIAKLEKEEYDAKNKDKVDETNLQMPAAAGLTAGKEIFTTVCWACHGKQGEGGAGPNLTDAYWLHKGSLTDIYLSIKHGYPDKGMQAWEKNYSPKDINNLAGFIKSLQGTNPPNAKAAQGDLFEAEAGTDSTKVKATL